MTEEKVAGSSSEQLGAGHPSSCPGRSILLRRGGRQNRSNLTSSNKMGWSGPPSRMRAGSWRGRRWRWPLRLCGGCGGFWSAGPTTVRRGLRPSARSMKRRGRKRVKKATYRAEETMQVEIAETGKGVQAPLTEEVAGSGQEATRAEEGNRRARKGEPAVEESEAASTVAQAHGLMLTQTTGRMVRQQSLGRQTERTSGRRRTASSTRRRASRTWW